MQNINLILKEVDHQVFEALKDIKRAKVVLKWILLMHI